MFRPKLVRPKTWQQAVAMSLLAIATSGKAATCFGQAQEDAASIYCTAHGGEDENCTFLWQLTMPDGSDLPWRGSFRVQPSETNALKLRQKLIAGPSGNFVYKCETALSSIGSGRVGDVDSDAADHFLQSNEAQDRERSLRVAKVSKRRLHHACQPRPRSATSALDANRVAGYDEPGSFECGSLGS